MSSLQVDDSSRRGRSKSPSGRERDRSSSRIERSPSGRDRDRDRDRDYERERERDRDDEPTIITAAPYPGEDDLGVDPNLDDPRKSVRIPDYDDYRGAVASPTSRGPPPSSDPKYRSSKYADADVDVRGDVDGRYGDSRREKEYRVEKESGSGSSRADYYERGGYERDTGREREKERDREREKAKGTTPALSEDKLAFLPAKYAKKADTGAASGPIRDSRSPGRGSDSSPPKGYYDERAERTDRPERPRSSQGPSTWSGEPPSVSSAPGARPPRSPPRSPRRGKSRGSNGGESDKTDDEDLAYGQGPVPSSKPRGNPAYGRGNERYAAAYGDEKDYGGGRGSSRDPHIITAEPRDAHSFDGRGSRDPRDPRSSRDLRDPRDDRERTATREETKYYRDDPRRDPRAELRADARLDPRPESRADPRANIINLLEGDPAYRDRSRSPMPTKGRERLSVNTLSVGGPHYAGTSVSSAPGSPMQEAYHGTYQSMSPMPSPLMLPSHGPSSDVQGLDINIYGPDADGSPTSARSPGGEAMEKIRRRARFYDPEEDAQRLAKALRGERHPPDTGPLIEILPGLTHDQVMELRAEYKRLVKTGPDRKGVNIAKHIRARLKDEDPALMKACYATALGRWESEAYWANFWYHGDKTRRELLIESLMGRTNDEIRHIKKSFSDKKYADSITKCMRTELKEDKFKRAVLFVLDEQRMEEFGRDGRPLPLDRDLVEEDAVALHRAVRAERGGETAMINVVVQRSDTHLREVLRVYSAHYQSNFARDCLKKSGNLVGEMLAHILNGVINKPVRDALLVHHALTTSKRDELRRELLISRLVRFHWDGNHMAAVKAAYRSRYNRDMQEAIRDATGSSDWGLFCRELCITRVPDDVKRVERIEIRHDDRH
ncbi:MAG: hypothetical protein STHCBS139747_000754 [Sporothrix thermara]